MEKSANPFSITDKIDSRNNESQVSSFSLLSVPVLQQNNLESWENPLWMENQLDQYEEELKNN